MINLSQEDMNNLVDQRLRQYLVQRFNFEMDLAAYVAIENEQGISNARAEIAKLDSAYAAIEALARRD